MHIIFGKENVANFDSKYTVLELDTFRLPPSGKKTTAFCIVESIPILNLSRVDQMKNLHNELLTNYRKRDWNFCTQAIEQLMGFWGSEMDTFYQTILSRIAKYMEQDPGESWDGTIEKHIVNS